MCTSDANIANFDKPNALIMSTFPVSDNFLAFHQCNCFNKFAILSSKLTFIAAALSYDK